MSHSSSSASPAAARAAGITFSARARRLAESATMRVSRRAGELKAAGHDIVDLSAGQPDFSSPACAVDAVRAALDAGHTRYTAAAGLPDLRAALAARYAERDGAPWTAENVIVTVGAKAALFELIQVLIDDGDEAVLPTPCWVSFEEQIRFAGGTPIGVPMDPRDGFAIHARPLIDAMTERTRLVLVNSPCNPTGGTISADDLRQLAAACAERGAVLLCDETYERFLYDGRTHVSGAALAGELPQSLVVVSSFSKTYSMTGWRLGWAAGHRDLIRKVLEVQSHATSNPTSFAMHGALAALRHAEPEVEAMIAEFSRRRQAVTAALDALPGISCFEPAGAFYAFPKVSDHFGAVTENGQSINGSLDLAEYLLEEAQVALVPGLAFGRDDHLRLAFACSVEDLRRGVTRIGEALAKLR